MKTTFYAWHSTKPALIPERQNQHHYDHNHRQRHATTAVLLAMATMVHFQAPAAFYIHSGMTDPATEGWMQQGVSSSPNISSGSIMDGGVPAWFVHDAGTQPGEGRQYAQYFSDAEALASLEQGWTMRLNARVTTVPLHPSASTQEFDMGFDHGSYAAVYAMGLGSAVDGDPMIALYYGTGEAMYLELSGLGGGYHEYVFQYSPQKGTAGFLVDGTTIYAGYTGFHHLSGGGIGNWIQWGACGSQQTGDANYSLVQVSLAAVPEPSTYLAGILLLSVTFAHLRASRRPCVRDTNPLG